MSASRASNRWRSFIRIRHGASAALLLVTVTSVLSPAALAAAGPRFPGTDCPAFPADNVWNTPITGLPVNAHSATWLSAMDATSTFLHPDYGPSGNPREPYGIPWQIVPPGTAFTRVAFDYAAESYRGPYPLTARTPIENGSDRHALMVDPRRSATTPACRSL